MRDRNLTCRKIEARGVLLPLNRPIVFVFLLIKEAVAPETSCKTFKSDPEVKKTPDVNSGYRGGHCHPGT